MRFQSLGLAARLDRGLITEASIEVEHDANDDGEDDEGDDLAVHVHIVPHSSGYASPCTGLFSKTRRRFSRCRVPYCEALDLCIGTPITIIVS